MRATAALLWLAAAPAAARRLSVSRNMALTIGDATCDVREYGAVLDGTTDDTNALQRALDACGAEGGGVVLVDGDLLMYSVNISHSNVELRVAGRLLLGDRKTYYQQTGNASAVIIIAADDVALTGGGVLDGRGLDWWQHRDDFRPKALKSGDTTRLLVHNFTFSDPPGHCLELYADFVELSKVNVFAPPSTGIDPSEESHNTDAYDVHGAYAYVHGCNFTTGDDNVAIHANHTLVEDSYFGTGHGASIGSLCDSWVTNVTVRRTTFDGTTVGCKIKTHEKCSGHVWNVAYEDLTMRGVKNVFDVGMFYGDPGDQKHTTMLIENVSFVNITSTDHQYDGHFNCSSDSPCRGLVFRNLTLRQSADEWSCDVGTGDACCAAARGAVHDVAPSGLTKCLEHS